MKVEQFKVKNQFIIRGGNEITFQSYDSTIAVVDNGSITLVQIGTIQELH